MSGLALISYGFSLLTDSQSSKKRMDDSRVLAHDEEDVGLFAHCSFPKL